MTNLNGFESDEQEAYEYKKFQEEQAAQEEPDVVPCDRCRKPMYELSDDPRLNICDDCKDNRDNTKDLDPEIRTLVTKNFKDLLWK